MTLSMMQTPRSYAVPQSQNTAPVLEFKCLYTHDVRRKQKRWQDGFVRYHTFNKRVMVYDVPRNFIGDTHCPQNGELQEGDELSLEREGVLVEVSEAVSRTEADLTELLQRRERQSGKKPSPLRPVGTGQKISQLSNMQKPVTHAAKLYTKHRSLNEMLASSNGPTGVANMPAKSPFELRHADREGQGGAERPSKRRKVQAPPPAVSPYFGSSEQQSPCVIRSGPGKHAHANVAQARTKTSTYDIHARQSKPVSGFIASDPVDSSMPTQKPSLKLVSNPARKMLICKDRLSRKDDKAPTTAHAPALQQPEERISNREPLTRAGPQRSVEVAPEPAPYQMRLQERLSKVGTRKRPVEHSSPPRRDQRLIPAASADRDLRAASHGSRDSPIEVEDQPVTFERFDLPDETIPDAVRKPSQPARPSPARGRPFLHPTARDPFPRRPTNESVRLKDGKDPPARTTQSSKQFSKPAQKTQQKTLNLNNGPLMRSKPILARPAATRTPSLDDLPVDEDKGPWSKEAFDLFDWRPPDKTAGGETLVH